MPPSSPLNSFGPLVQPEMGLEDVNPLFPPHYLRSSLSSSSAFSSLQFLESFWTSRMELAESEDPDFKHHVLPLARIKKVMKSDEDVQVSFVSSFPFLFLSRLAQLLCFLWTELTVLSSLVSLR